VPAGAPPLAAGQSAVFDATGTASVVMTAGPIAPDSWTFNANSQSYSVSGAAVNFGTTAGLVNNASAGQTISIANNLGGAAAQVQQLGASTLTLSGTNSYTGVTTIAAGTLALTGTGSIAASSQVNLTNTGATFDISGTTAGASIVSLKGVSGSNVNLGTQTLTVTNGNALDIYYGAIGGSGGLTATGGFAMLGGANTYTGVTDITTTGELVVEGTGSIASSSKVINNGTLDLSVMSVDTSIKSLAGTNAGANLFLGNQSLILTAANDTYAGMISGNGALTLMAGTETLTGAIGYNGATTINGGTLVVNVSLASSSGTTVNAGGTLMGTGALGHTSISGGTFAPGSGTPGSSLTVFGPLGFTAGSTYAVNINPTTSSFANVVGTATLGGAMVNAIYTSGSYVAKKYTILTAGVVSGSFGSLVNSNLPINFATGLSYDAKNAYLNLALNFTPSGSAPSGSTPSGSAASSFGAGLNANQRNVGNTLTNFFNTTGGIPLVFGALTRSGLSQASGETATGSQQTTFNAMTQFMGVMTDPFIDGRGNGGAPQGSGAGGYAATQDTGAARNAFAMFNKAPVATFEQRWSKWVAGFGGSQTTDGNTAVGSRATSRVYGTAVGADYRFSPDTIAGFSLAGGGTNFSVANAGTGHSDLCQAGAFVRHTVGAAYLSAALAYGWQDVTTDRTVTISGVDQLRARFDANAWSGRAEGGYRFVTPVMGLTPYADGQFTTFDLPSYAEGVLSGASTFALSYGAKSVTDARSELGIRTDKSWALQDSVLTLRGRLAWAHDYDPDRSIAATFQALPGASFVVNGAAQASDSALTTASAEIKWINGWSAAATFEGEFSDFTRSYAGKGVVRCLVTAAADLAQAARSPGSAASPAIPVPATVPPATVAAAAEPEAAEPATAATSAATKAAAATSAAAAPATATAAAAPAATSAATTTTASAAGQLHAAANVFPIEDVERGETDVGHFLFAENKALIGRGIVKLRDIGSGRRRCGCTTHQRKTQSGGTQRLHGRGFGSALLLRSLLDRHGRILRRVL
jgi:autotransporter-associated beta strand protein